MSDDEGPETTPGYKISKKVDMGTILEMDNEDESLRKYKEALLGKAALSGAVAPSDDPRRVVITRMKVICKERPNGDILYDFTERGSEQKLKDQPFTLKEKCEYKIEVAFRVQHEIVAGLKFINLVFRKGVRVAKEEEMLGSFPPQGEAHVVVFPRHGWEEAPSGMLARGNYKGKHKFVDDDGQCHLEYEYTFAIKKDWE
ncbi:rho guanine dissociation factor isoform 2, putative [Acanthamoeba castellanii str. Neff]|uniref:Rho guanine dissociation factor isoform 2, putative n=1 Tax=Acanthamoeba castellanii (strain ATCC 30010 / Neff) TaxID=1257118 RepID=L8HGS9_ACACF|nr:rho guanine dissociation factor isoform 2, putative [Acanthamoeba castellanii str. Neff]ELR24764.1 rho guanine dissociation factor isoform 2, putative [Acanthamoeba castellanii str. Neff]